MNDNLLYLYTSIDYKLRNKQELTDREYKLLAIYLLIIIETDIKELVKKTITFLMERDITK